MYLSADHIRVEIKDVELDGVEWVCMAQDRDFFSFFEYEKETFGSKTFV
jgi:hypothetical protein